MRRKTPWSTMDPATAILLLTTQPVQLDRHTAWLSGAFMPVALPVDGLPTDLRTAWLMADANAPLEQRVEAALTAGRTEVAWALVISASRPVVGLLEIPLNRWSAGELARLKLPAPNGPILALTGDESDARRLADIGGSALADLSDYLPLPWPRWTGPLVMISAEAQIDPAPGRTRLSRPALPVLRIADPEVGAVAAAITMLALDLTAPPADGWPIWLRRGLITLAQQHARGRGMGPLHAREVRQGAGSEGLTELFLSNQPDDERAAALCLPLINPSRRQRFTALLDLLRNGASGAGAVKIAYGWNLDDLLTVR